MESDLKDIELEYSPSHWSKRYPPDLVVVKHVEVVTKVSKLVKETVPHETVSYGAENTSKLDIFGTSLASDSPIFVYIHGGYWQDLSKDVSCYPVQPLVKSKIKVFVPEYTLAPEATLGEIVDQIKKLGEFVLKYAVEHGVRSVWFGGHSAGAHLAALLLDESWFKSFELSTLRIFRGLVLISGVYDLVPLVPTYINEPLKLDEQEAKKLSPMYKDLKWFKHCSIDLQVALAVSENDSPSFKLQTASYEKFLSSEKVPTKLFFIPKKDHFDVVESLSNLDYSLTLSIIDLIQTDLKKITKYRCKFFNSYSNKE